MPMYDYECDVCHSVHSDLVKISDRDLIQQCPACLNDSHRVTVHAPVAYDPTGITGSKPNRSTR